MIKKLPECIISRIAAGEVITSPYNIIKELLENSIDAGASRVSIALSSTLLSLSVDDNGSGVSPEDLGIICLNHTTSKIETLDDLKRCGTISALASFGFRGEALHSIGVSSHLAITSRTGGSALAYRGEYNGPELLSMAKVAREGTGTSIEVNDIFYRNSIRREYFYKNKMECLNCIDLVKSYGCIYSGIEMRVDERLVLMRDDGPKRLDAARSKVAQNEPGCADGFARRIEVQSIATGGISGAGGANPSPALAEMDANEAGQAAADGNAVDSTATRSAIENKIDYIIKAFLGRESTKEMLVTKLTAEYLLIFTDKQLVFKKYRFILFINGRLVKNNSLKRRVLQKYRRAIKDGVFPFIYAEIFMDYVDVNVHPSKAEVLVGDETVFDRIVKAVEAGLMNDSQYITGSVPAQLSGDSAPGPLSGSIMESFIINDSSLGQERGGSPISGGRIEERLYSADGGALEERDLSAGSEIAMHKINRSTGEMDAAAGSTDQCDMKSSTLILTGENDGYSMKIHRQTSDSSAQAYALSDENVTPENHSEIRLEIITPGNALSGAEGPCTSEGIKNAECSASQNAMPSGPLYGSGSQFSKGEIKVYTFPQIRTLEESLQKDKFAKKKYSLLSLRTLHSEIKETDSMFFRALAYVGTVGDIIFAQSHTNLIKIEKRNFQREYFYMKVLMDFGNFQSRPIPGCSTRTDESLHGMLQEYFGITFANGKIVEAPVIAGVCMEDWSSFQIEKGAEYATIKSVVEEISKIYQNAETDQKLFNMMKNEVTGTRSLIECCSIVVALKDLYKKFGRC